MARKRKQTEQAPVSIEELPRDLQELSSEEAEATKGGVFADDIIVGAGTGHSGGT